MSMTRSLAAVVGAALASALVVPGASAGLYPTQSCVAAKLKSMAKQCQADLQAWSNWETNQNDGVRNTALSFDATQLADAWTKAEGKATAKGVDCAATTLTSSEASAEVTAGVNAIVTAINSGLTLTNQTPDGKCGTALVKAASKKCGAFLKAQSTWFKKLAKDPQGTARDALLDKARTKFGASFAKALAACPMTETATATDIETAVDDLTDTLVTDNSTSPHLASTWTEVDAPAPGSTFDYNGETLTPICSRGTQYIYWVKRGTDDGVHKLLVYYQGGGACWDQLTCDPSTHAFDDAADPGDNPANTTTGFGDLSNPDNPFRNWNAVFITYCTGDVHWGSNFKGYGGGISIHHNGYDNAKLVEKFAREHFVNPDEIFVTGSSAGAYGAILHGVLLHPVFPASRFNVVGDAGNGVITQAFLANNLESSWSVQKHLPTFVTGLNANITTLTIADLYGKSALFFQPRGSRFGQYTSAYDGGSGSQTFFYDVMVNGIVDAATAWWHSSCSWHSQMLDNATTAEGEAPANYRFYVMPGSRHTIWGSNRVYSETHGGVQTFVSWLNDMRSGSLTWSDSTCSDCSLLGSCAGGTNDTFSCQHDSECPGGVCNLADAKPGFKCNGGTNNNNACERDADCPGGVCQVEASFGVCDAATTINSRYKVCSSNSDCPGGTCVTEQPFQLDGVVTCP